MNLTVLVGSNYSDSLQVDSYVCRHLNEFIDNLVTDGLVQSIVKSLGAILE